jgi:hypothetical protein
MLRSENAALAPQNFETKLSPLFTSRLLLVQQIKAAFRGGIIPSYPIMDAAAPFPFISRLKDVVPTIILHQGFDVVLPNLSRSRPFVMWFGLHEARNFSTSRTRYDPTSCGSTLYSGLLPNCGRGWRRK